MSKYTNRHARRNETNGVRAALKAAGYTGISVKHGNGTTWGWLYVTVDRPVRSSYLMAQGCVCRLVVETSGRDTEYTRGQVMVTLRKMEG